MTLFNNSSLPRHPIARDHTGHFYGTHPWQSMTLVSKWNIKLALIWKEDFGPLGNSTVLLFLSPGKTPLTTTAANISILPKISRFWLFALCRLIVMTLFHESYLQRSIALVVLWCHTMIGAQLQDQLCTIPACYWSNYFGCFKQYKISWPGHVPYKCHMATLAPFWRGSWRMCVLWSECKQAASRASIVYVQEKLTCVSWYSPQWPYFVTRRRRIV